MKKINVDRKFIKKIANNFTEVNPELLKEALSDDLSNKPDTFFLDKHTRTYPVGTAAHAYTSYLGAVCCNDAKSAEKIANILKDIYDIEPPKPKKIEKKASAQPVAPELVKFLPRDKRYQVKLAALKEGYVSSETCEELMSLRATFYNMNHHSPDPKVSEAYAKVASIAKAYDEADKPITKKELAKIASIIEHIDKEAGVDRYYDKYLMDPVDVVNSMITTRKPPVVKLGGLVVNKDNIKKINRVHLEGILDKAAMDYLFGQDDSINIERFEKFACYADGQTLNKLRKVLGMILTNE